MRPWPVYLPPLIAVAIYSWRFVSIASIFFRIADAFVRQHRAIVAELQKRERRKQYYKLFKYIYINKEYNCLSTYL